MGKIDWEDWDIEEIEPIGYMLNKLSNKDILRLFRVGDMVSISISGKYYNKN